MKLSVIVPVYNCEKYIQQCLESIINQIIDEKEIIIINDGSTDNTMYILEKYRKLYTNIILINQENKGVSYARNVGLNIATGEYIGFVDSDDYINTHMYEIMYNTAKETNADFVTCGYNRVNNGNIGVFKNEYENLNYEEIIDKYFEGKITTMVCLGLFKRNIFNNIRFPINMSYAEDAFVIFKIILKSSKVICLKENLYYYRITIGSPSNIVFNDNIWQLLLANKNSKKLLIKNEIFDKYKYSLDIMNLKAILLLISSYSCNTIWSDKNKIKNINHILSKFFSKNEIINLCKNYRGDSLYILVIKTQIKLYLKYPKQSIFLQKNKGNLLNRIKNNYPNIFFILRRIKELL